MVAALAVLGRRRRKGRQRGRRRRGSASVRASAWPGPPLRGEGARRGDARCFRRSLGARRREVDESGALRLLRHHVGGDSSGMRRRAGGRAGGRESRRDVCIKEGGCLVALQVAAESGFLSARSWVSPRTAESCVMAPTGLQKTGAWLLIGRGGGGAERQPAWLSTTGCCGVRAAVSLFVCACITRPRAIVLGCF
jgi:hypothetical protein